LIFNEEYVGRAKVGPMHGKQSKYLPNEIGNLKLLETLNLRYNHLTSFPDSMGSLGALKTLWSSDNQISKVPKALIELTSWSDDAFKPSDTSFSEISLWNNPLDSKSLSLLKELKKKGVNVVFHKYKYFPT